MGSDTTEELPQQDLYLCTGCRYTFTLERFGYRPDRPEGTRFTTCINCRNRGRGLLAKRKMPVGIPRLRTGRGARQTTAPSGGTTTTTGRKRRVPGNQSTARSSSVMPPPMSPVIAHDNQTPYPPQVADTHSLQLPGHLSTGLRPEVVANPSSSLQLPGDLSTGLRPEVVANPSSSLPNPGDPLNRLCSKVALNPSSSLPLPDLEIFFGFQRHPTSVNVNVAYFDPPYPPSLEIFLVMLQIRHDILEMEDIRGVYLENERGQFKAFENIQGRAETWDVIMGILFKTAASVKVYVEACYPVKTYCTCITRSID